MEMLFSFFGLGIIFICLCDSYFYWERLKYVRGIDRLFLALHIPIILFGIYLIAT